MSREDDYSELLYRENPFNLNPETFFNTDLKEFCDPVDDALKLRFFERESCDEFLSPQVLLLKNTEQLLPLECIHYIISFLSDENILRSFSVCQRWKFSMIRYVREICLSHNKRGISFTEFSNLRFLIQLKSLVVDNLDLVLDSFFEEISSSHKWMFEDSTGYTNIVTRWILFVVSELRQLEELSIKLPSIDYFGAGCISTLINLKKLELEGGFYLCQDDYILMIRNLHCLEHLNLQGSKNVSDAVISSVLSVLPNLSHLNLSITSITSASLKTISMLPLLKILHLTKCPYLYRVHLESDSLSRLSNLNELYITDCYLTDESVKSISSLKNLKTLEMEEGRFTERGLKDIIDSLPNLVHLNISKSELNFIDFDFQQLHCLLTLQSLKINPSLIPKKNLIELSWLLKDILDDDFDDYSVSPIISAATFGYLDSVVKFYYAGISIEETDEHDKTALMLAVENGHFELVNFFVHKNAAISAVDEEGNTSVLLACRKGNLNILKFLLQFGANSNDKNYNNESCVINAAISGSVEVIEYLRNNCGHEIINDQDIHGSSSLLCASMFGNFETVKWLLHNGSSIYETNDYGCNAFILSVINNHLKIAAYLLELGSDINMKNSLGESPILCAANEGHLKMVEWLLLNGAMIDDKDEHGCTPLLLASMNGHLNLVKWLYKMGSSIHLKNHYGCSPLILSSINGHLEVVMWLIEKGAYINCKNNEGETPLICSASEGHLSILLWLIQNGADVDTRNSFGENALLCAVDGGFLEIVKCLASYYHPYPKEWETALLLATICGNLEIVKFIHEMGVSLQVRTNKGRTPLLLSVINGDLKMAKWLYQHGSSLTDCDYDGYSALAISDDIGQLDISKWIQEKNEASLFL